MAGPIAERRALLPSFSNIGAFLACALLAGAGCSLPGRSSPPLGEVAMEEARDWIRHTVPLPHRIEIAAKAILSPGDIAVVGAATDAPPALEAERVLREAVGSSLPSESSLSAAFRLTLALVGPEVATAEAVGLAALPNAEEAYRILPEGDGRALRIAALSPRGLLHGARTLAQLLRARRSEGRVEVPIVAVVDWPDLEDRGLWGTDTHACLSWLAERKLDLVEQISAVSVEGETKRASARLKPARETMIEDGPRLGIEPVPAILHLEQLEGKGVFEAYPELRARAGPEGVVGEGAICYSQPAIVGVLAEWILQLSRLPGVDDVDVWLAENLQGKGGCRCAACAPEDRSILEVRAVIEAWREAERRLAEAKEGQETGEAPGGGTDGIGLRILTSEETYRSLEGVFREIPPEVKVWYYHSLLTYTVRKAPMVGGTVEREAAAGRWIGVVPILVGHVRATTPFTGPQFVHALLTELRAKRVRGILGYATPRVRFGRFNVEAVAEWSWNAGGRTPREFAVSWAAREGIPDKEAFGDWVEALGPVAWSVYGSEWPAGERRKFPGRASELLLEGRLPELGKGKGRTLLFPWGDVCCDEELERHLSSASRALEIARGLAGGQLGDEILEETLVVEGHIRALKALRELRRIGRPGDVAAARRWFDEYDAALAQAAEALPRWEQAVEAEATAELLTEERSVSAGRAETDGTRERGRFTAGTVELIEGMRQAMRDAAAQWPERAAGDPAVPGAAASGTTAR